MPCTSSRSPGGALVARRRKKLGQILAEALAQKKIISCPRSHHWPGSGAAVCACVGSSGQFLLALPSGQLSPTVPCSPKNWSGVERARFARVIALYHDAPELTAAGQRFEAAVGLPDAQGTPCEPLESDP